MFYPIASLFYILQCEVSSLSESPEEEEVDTPEEQRKELWSSETESATISPTEFSPTTDTWSESPRKRTQTLPSLGCPPVARIAREPNWDRWSRFPDSFNENDEKTLSEDIFKLLDLQKVTLFSGVQKSENEKAEKGQKDKDNTDSCKTGSDVVVKQVDPPKAQAQNTAHVPKPQPRIVVSQAALSKEKPAAPAQQTNNTVQPENTDSTSVINRYGSIYSISLLIIFFALSSRVRDLNKEVKIGKEGKRARW